MPEIRFLVKIKSIFSAAANRENLVSGEDLEVSLSKIKKWLSDMQPVAFSGSYSDLSNKPTIPTVNNGTLTIQKNGTNVATFTANQAGNTTANITTTDELSLTGAVEGSGTLNNGAISVVANRKSCYVGNGSGSAITNSWFLTAQVDVAQNSYVYKATFYVELGIDTTLSNVGILEVVVRKTSDTLQFMKAKWIVGGSEINLGDFALSYDSTSHLCSLYINRPAAYSVYRLTSIAESERGGGGDKADVWTLYNNTSTGIASPPSGTGITTIYSELADTHLSQQVNNNSKLSETSDTTPYIYKSSEHDAVYDELVGGSVAWNQLVQNGNFESTSRWNGRYSTISVSNNVCTVTPSSNGTFRGLIGVDTITDTTIAGHKYLISVDVLSPIATNIALSMEGIEAQFVYAPINSWRRCSCIWTNTSSARRRIYALLVDNVTTSQTIMYKNVYTIDLTQMFGSTIADYAYNLEQSTAGSGVEWLKSYGFFTKDYYAYNAGGLVSVNTSGKKVVGKNLLEITTNSETINGVTFIVDKEAGTIIVNGTATATTFFGFNLNLALNLPRNVELKLTGCPSGGSVTSYRIDLRDSVAGLTYNNAADEGTGTTFTITGDGCNVANIRIQNGYVCNNLVFKPMIRRADVTDPTFEPYTSITYPIQSTDLRGLYKLNGNKLYTDGDIYSADGQITRKYGIVDLGTLEWMYDASHNRIYATNALIKRNNDSTIANAVCNKYTICTRNDLFTTDKAVSINYSGGTSWINVRDTAYITEEAFKTAMSGVYLIYELATPTAGIASPYTSPQMVYRNGTEEYLDTRDVPIPVGGNRKYVDIPDWMVNEYFDDVRVKSEIVSQKAVRVEPVMGDIGTLVFPDGIHEIDWYDSEGVINVSNAATFLRSAEYIQTRSNWMDIECAEDDTYGGAYRLTVDGEKENTWGRPAIRLEETYSGNKIDIGKDNINLFASAAELKLNSDGTISIEPQNAYYQFASTGFGARVSQNGYKYYELIPRVDDNHNGIFRGADLTNAWVENGKIKESLYTKVHSGDFSGLYLGDYFTVSITTDIYTLFTGTTFVTGTTYYTQSGSYPNWVYTATSDAAPVSGKTYFTKQTVTENVDLMIAAFDYYYNTGDTALTTHHLVLIPRDCGFETTAKMNSTNITTGSYYNCEMHQFTLPCYAKSLKTALNNHLLSHRTRLPNAIDASTPSMAGADFTGASNAWAWYTTELQLMNEVQIYGTTVWSSSAYDVGVDYKKLPVFDFINGVQYGRNNFWLRSVVSSTSFANCATSGFAGNGGGASNALFVRPLILFG